MSQGNALKSGQLAEHDQLRVQFYRLLARLLAGPPPADALAVVRGLTGDETDMGRAIGALADAARDADPAALKSEYNRLFIGVGRGELVPYGSYYLTGFLNEKPLARLREDMLPLGIARSDDVKEPEDHVAALMDMMAGLIDGAFGEMRPFQLQRAFFTRHIGNWTPHFFADLEKAKGANFYKPVGAIGRLFMEIEAQAFDMEA